MNKNIRKNKKLKKVFENLFIRLLATLIFFSPVVLYCMACYISSLI